MESTVAKGPRTRVRGLARIGDLSATRAARWGLAGLLLAALVGFLAYPTYPNYDSYYAMLWGHELVHLHALSFEAYRAPTEHPLAIAFGALMSLLGRGADRVIVLITILSLVAMVAAAYRLSRRAFTPFVGLLAGLIVITRFDYPFLAVRAYLDVPYIAIVMWAAVLEYERPRRGGIVWVLLAAASMLRPEAWVLAGLYWLWIGWPELRAIADRRWSSVQWGRIARFTAWAAIGPVVWMAVDGAVTGDPLFSLHSTSGLASELGRQRSLSDVPAALPQFLGQLDKAPILAAGIIGLGLGLWFVPKRTVMPAILFFSGVGTFVLVGVAGLSVINRYLVVASVAVCIFAALAIGGFTMLPRHTRARKVWQGTSVAAVLFALVFTVLHSPSLGAFNNELVFRRDSHRSLVRLLDSEPVRSALRRGCGPVSTPSHKIIPDVRWILDLPASQVLARSDAKRAHRTRRGLALYVAGRKTLQRQGFASNTDPLTEVPQAGFVRIGTDRYYAAYARCAGA